MVYLILLLPNCKSDISKVYTPGAMGKKPSSCRHGLKGVVVSSTGVVVVSSTGVDVGSKKNLTKKKLYNKILNIKKYYF